MNYHINTYDSKRPTVLMSSEAFPTEEAAIASLAHSKQVDAEILAEYERDNALAMTSDLFDETKDEMIKMVKALYEKFIDQELRAEGARQVNSVNLQSDEP